MPPSVRSAALVGNYLPRQCGIATFTADLAAAIADNDPGIDCLVVAMNDRAEGYEYPDAVKFQISQDKLNEYDLAADFLNMRDPDVVCLQHEYGIFGGQRGSFVIELARNLNVPLITTLHTVLKDPSPQELQIVKQLAEVSASLVVMSEHGAQFLRDVYQVPTTKIELIHHGILDVPFLDSDLARSKVAASDKTMILTFGLLSPGKGIEHVIDALPEIVRQHPNVVYFVVGATHPHSKAEDGEDYRLSLHLRAKEMGVADNIVFHDRFVDRDELVKLIRAADIYVTPYLNEAQVVSGTLAFALGAGKAVVSTPYWHAQEMLADGRGRLVSFRDSGALARSISDLLDHPEERFAMRQAAYDYCRPMVMREMGLRYLKVFSDAVADRVPAIIDVPALDTLNHHQKRLPQINLKHLGRMTDGTGVLQHATFTVPNRSHGYCTDDNARALIVATRAHDLNPNDVELIALSSTYLSFLDHSFNPGTGRFRNFMSYERKWLDDVGSEDSHGRALWALGVMASWGRGAGQVAVATRLFRTGLAAVEHFSDSRAIAFPILGIQAYLRRNADDEARELLGALGQRLEDRFRKFATEDWWWHEESLAYDNARVPQALLACGRITGDQDMVALGTKVLEWLRDIQLDPSAGCFAPIGNRGWFRKSGAKAKYDQQPLEAAAMIGACLEAYECTHGQEWIELAATCFDWYLGKNDQRIMLYDDSTGGCRDGLQAGSANENQGAESTLSYMLSLIAMYNLRGLTFNETKRRELKSERTLAGRAREPAKSVRES